MKSKWMLSICAWLYSSVRIDKEKVIALLDGIDTDDDGYITVGEVIAYIREWLTK